jgi:hypothetical protein
VPFAIERGKILAYRVFDAGEEISLDVAEKRIPGAKRLELTSPLSEGLLIAVRPLEIELESCEVTLPGVKTKVTAKCSARVFDFGAVSVLYEIDIDPGMTFAELTPICDGLYDAVELDARGCEHRGDIIEKLGPALEKPHEWTETETYTIVFIEQLRGCTTADLETSEELAKLLLGETSDKPLSPAVREDVLKNRYSYLNDDLVVIDWNSAVVVEPTGSRVVCHVLELATSQLLEFRYYDESIDRELAKVYDYVEKTRPRVLRSPFGALTRDVLRRYMELTEFTERVDNAIKSVGDFYLARVYLSAIRRFRVPEWRESVETKLELVSRAYELLKGETEVSRTQLLELTVVVLILVEILAAFQRH